MDHARNFQDLTTDDGALLRKAAARVKVILPAFAPAVGKSHPRFGTLSRSLAGTVALVFSILVFPQTATATAFVTTFADVAGTHISPSQDFDSAAGAFGQVAHSSSSASGSGSGQTAGSTANGSAVEKALHASAFSNMTTFGGGPQNSAFGTSSTTSSWSDSMIVHPTSSSLLGQPGTYTVPFHVSGTFGGSLGGPVSNLALADQSAFHVFVQIFGTGMAGDPACQGPAYCAEQSSSSGNIFGGPQIFVDAIPAIIIANIPFIFGSPVTLGYHLDLRTQTHTFSAGNGTGTSANSFVDFSHSLLWGGITGVFDVNGNAVNDFTTTSASGVDYGQGVAPAVPEPITLSLLVAGLGGMAWLRRRTRLARRIIGVRLTL